jgi:putative membrane protein
MSDRARSSARAALVAGTVAAAAPPAALAHGEGAPAGEVWTTWDVAPIPVAAAVLALALFGQGFVRLRRRGRSDHARPSRAALFALGTGVLTLALVSPLDAVGENYLLSAHMLQHVLIGDVAPLLLVLALRGPLTFFLLPPRLLRVLAPIRPLRAALRFLLRPSVAFGVWVVVLAGWHLPSAYEYALAHRWAHDLEHASFVVAGCLVWAQLVDPARRAALSTPSGRVLFAGALFVTGHALVHPLLFGGGVAYETYAQADARLLGLSPLGDQHLAGAVMTADQLLTLGGCVLVLLWPHLRSFKRSATNTI